VKQYYEEHGLSVELREFIPDMPTLLQETTLVISRAGATTLAELACAGIPALLIPDPRAIRDHQRLNAERYQSAGAAAMVLQSSDLAETIQQVSHQLNLWLAEPETRQRMSQRMCSLARPDATAAVLRVLQPWLTHAKTPG